MLSFFRIPKAPGPVPLRAWLDSPQMSTDFPSPFYSFLVPVSPSSPVSADEACISLQDMLFKTLTSPKGCRYTLYPINISTGELIALPVCRPFKSPLRGTVFLIFAGRNLSRKDLSAVSCLHLQYQNTSWDKINTEKNVCQKNVEQVDTPSQMSGDCRPGCWPLGQEHAVGGSREWWGLG